MRRQTGLYVLFAVVSLLLTGCLGTPRTETILMDDAEQRGSDEDEASLFNVETIYTVLDGDKEPLFPIGWIDDNSLLGITPSYRPYFNRVNEPYAARQKLLDPGPFQAEGTYNSIVLSPDQRHVSYVDMTGNAIELNLHSLSDGENSRIEISRSKSIYFTQMSWSNNSRFFSYADSDEMDGAALLFVYDRTEKKTKRYKLPGSQLNEWVWFVSVSDNGEDAVIVKTSGRDSMMEWGKLSGDAFIPQYRHPISTDGRVEWIHPDQIAFVGADGTLYAYDQRNRLLSAMLNDVGRFRLSGDRKFIAYTQGDDVYAASMYGNTVLNRKQIYKGIDAYGMEWSPTNGKLLVYGLKSGSPQAVRELVSAADPVSQSLVIAFK
ncbi:hypothetical protein [Cohnella hongkongensis]|uniref:WD40 repeat domain-containing protein n=1 Tax=Cohnella hongkongensis TaxID=178337 RepID=A0ABV9FCG3_9BACL